MSFDLEVFLNDEIHQHREISVHPIRSVWKISRIAKITMVMNTSCEGIDMNSHYCVLKTRSCYPYFLATRPSRSENKKSRQEKTKNKKTLNKQINK